MKWTQDIISKIRDANDIVDWIGRDTVLKDHSNGKFSGLCPFPNHKEKTPSFSISADKQVYFCFGCQKGGDIFTYFRDQKSMTFGETVQYLAQQAGINLQADSSSSGASSSLKNDYLTINKLIQEQAHKKLLQLPEQHPAKKYLKKRGYSEETIQKFKLGYGLTASEMTQALSETDKKKAIELGLLFHKVSYYTPYQNRCLFPIISPMNQTLGFGGRSLDNSMPKYLNSRDSICFQKGHIFYGLNESSSFIRKESYAILVEGYTDFLSLYQNGFKNVVATLGTALTPQHGRLLRRYTDKVILLFDGDSAGEKAALRSLPILLEEGVRVRKADLNGMDPDECLSKHGVEHLKEIIGKNQDLFLHMFSNQIQDIKGMDRLNSLESIVPILSRIKDQALKTYYTRHVLDAFLPLEQKSAQMILSKAGYREKEATPRAETPPAPTIEKIDLTEAPRIELYLLALSLHQSSYLLKIEEQIKKQDLMPELHLNKLFSQIFEEYHKEPALFDHLLAKVHAFIAPESWLHTDNYIVLKDLTEEDGVSFINDCLARLSLNNENVKLKTLLGQMRIDDKNQEKYLKKINQVKKNIFSMERSNEK